MIKKPTPYVNNPGTTSDSVLREVSDLYGKSLRVSDANSVVDRHFTHFRADYDVNGNPTRIKYYHGATARSTSFTLGMASTLGGKYFKLYTAPDNQLVTVWFNLNGASTQPTVVNTFKYIEIPLLSSDTSYMVGTALKLTIDGLYSNYFYTVLDDGIQIQIITSQMGECSASDSGTSGFIFLQVAGTQEIVQDIEIAYSGKDPIFNGQVLKGYAYNITAGKFEPSGAQDTAGDIGLLEGVLYDDIQATYPNATTENYAYYLQSALQATIEVTYSDTAKSTFLRARRV